MRKSNICQIRATKRENKANQGVIIAEKFPEILKAIYLQFQKA